MDLTSPVSHPGYGRPRCAWMAFETFIRYAGLSVGLMVFETFIRSAGLAVGLKPSAMGCEARLRGLYQMMYSKTISPRLRDAKPACAGYAGLYQVELAIPHGPAHLHSSTAPHRALESC